MSNMALMYAIPSLQEIHLSDDFVQKLPRMKDLLVTSNGWENPGAYIYQTKVDMGNDSWLDLLSNWLLRNGFSWSIETADDDRYMFAVMDGKLYV